MSVFFIFGASFQLLFINFPKPCCTQDGTQASKLRRLSLSAYSAAYTRQEKKSD